MNRKIVLISLITIATLLSGFALSQGRIKAASIYLINSTASLYLPMTVKSEGPSAATPSGTLYVFFSNATTDGNAGGRTGMNAICTETDPGSHFCSQHEIENAFTTNGVYFNVPFSAQGWLDYFDQLGTKAIHIDGSFSPSYWSGPSSSCYAWTQNVGDTGRMIFNGGATNSSDCSQILNVTCCKAIP